MNWTSHVNIEDAANLIQPVNNWGQVFTRAAEPDMTTASRTEIFNDF